MNIDNWAPTPIGWADNPDKDIVKNKLENICLKLKEKTKSEKNWVSQSIYTSINSHNIYQDENFDILNIWVDEKIDEYKEQLKIKNDLFCSGGWFNIYEKYDYQEFHQHKGHDLSAVYFLKTNIDGPKLIFENPTNDVFALNTEFDNFAPRFFYESLEGRLIIFSSNLRHCVEQHMQEDKRITLAYNYNKKV